jgi:hypothetical protein
MAKRMESLRASLVKDLAERRNRQNRSVERGRPDDAEFYQGAAAGIEVALLAVAEAIEAEEGIAGMILRVENLRDDVEANPSDHWYRGFECTISGLATHMRRGLVSDA